MASRARSDSQPNLRNRETVSGPGKKRERQLITVSTRTLVGRRELFPLPRHFAVGLHQRVEQFEYGAPRLIERETSSVRKRRACRIGMADSRQDECNRLRGCHIIQRGRQQQNVNRIVHTVRRSRRGKRDRLLILGDVPLRDQISPRCTRALVALTVSPGTVTLSIV